MKSNSLFYFIIIVFLIPTVTFAESDWMWHNNNREPYWTDREDNVEVYIKIGYQFYVDNVYIYFTTDGSRPAGSMGVATNGIALPMVWDRLEWDDNAQKYADWWKGTLPSHERGTVVKYIISCWHSGGGEEHYAESNTANLNDADVFSYTIREKPIQAITGEAITITARVEIAGITDSPGPPADLLVECYTDALSADLNAPWRAVSLDFVKDDGDTDVFEGALTPIRIGFAHYVIRYSTDNGQTWTYQGAPTDADSWTKIIVSPDWIRDAIVYQYFPRIHGATDANGNHLIENSEFGDFNGVMADLDRIAALGVNTLWLMPIHPLSTNPAYIKSTDGSAGSPYAPKDYRAINPDYGDEAALHRLITAARARGLRVIIGFVANHVAPDCVILDPSNPPGNGGYHPDWFVQNAQGTPIPDTPDWSDTVAWNYDCADKENLYRYVADSIKYWVREFDVDGYRCDFAHWQPPDFWELAIAETQAIKPETLFLAEAFELVPELEEAGFAIVYDFPWYNYIKDEVRTGNADANGLKQQLDWINSWQLQNFLPYRYAENHDEPRAAELYGSAEGTRPLTALSFTTRAVPMLYAGQETGDYRRIPLFRSWGGLEDYPAPDWNFNMQALTWHRKLIAARNQHIALRRGTEKRLTVSNNKIFAFTRYFPGDRIIVAVNLDLQSANPQNGRITLDLADLNMTVSEEYALSETFSGAVQYLDGTNVARMSLNLPANGVQIWSVEHAALFPTPTPTQTAQITPTETPTPSPTVTPEPEQIFIGAAGYLSTHIDSHGGGLSFIALPFGATEKLTSLEFYLYDTPTGVFLHEMLDGSYMLYSVTLPAGTPAARFLLTLHGTADAGLTVDEWPFFTVK